MQALVITNEKVAGVVEQPSGGVIGLGDVAQGVEYH